VGFDSPGIGWAGEGCSQAAVCIPLLLITTTGRQLESIVQR